MNDQNTVSSDRNWTFVKTAKLTKSLLMGLSEIHYFNSNCQPGIREHVSPKAQRNEQWERVKKAGMNGLNCSIWDTTKPDPRPSSHGILRTGKMTKKFLMSLDEGISATIIGCGFFEQVLPMAERNEQWQRAKTKGAVGRNCMVFDNAIHTPKP